MSWALDKRLNSLDAYVPGEQPKPGEFIKLNTNEFPYAPAEGVENATIKAVETMHLYSDLRCSNLTNAFCGVFHCKKDNVIFTNGSDEALYLCFLTFCGKETGVAFADITYGFYSVYADLCGLEKTIIPLNDNFAIDPKDYFKLGKTIFIANPNAPTGLKLSKTQVESILINNPNNVVVIDEAYADFSDGSCASLVNEYNNLIVVGTFSKSRGMAGARLGYLITNNDLLSDIQTVKYSINPYNVNSLTQATGVAVLNNNSYYADKIKEICNTRDLFIKNLKSIGFQVIPSQTNFVFAKHDSCSGEYITNELRNNGVLIRHFKQERIKEYVRITIGTPEQMQIVFSVLEKIVGGK